MNYQCSIVPVTTAISLYCARSVPVYAVLPAPVIALLLPNYLHDKLVAWDEEYMTNRVLVWAEPGQQP